jgi:putative transposase
MTKQCELLSIHRSGIYYKPTEESKLNLKLMRMMDEHYLNHPFKGAARMHTWLTKDEGLTVSRNRIERLYYRIMGLRAVMPGKHTSRRHKAHKTYPYLLRNLTVERPNQVWAMDITYIPMKKGYMYLTAIIDLYSRYVVSWSVSNSMDADWCRNCLEEAIETHGKPEIINTDQGSQFTSEVFANYVLGQGIRLSMDGKGRAIDNAFIERLWRSVKYEKLYLNPPMDGMDLYLKVAEYFAYYNTGRRHSGIDDQIPEQLYFLHPKQAA